MLLQKKERLNFWEIQNTDIISITSTTIAHLISKYLKKNKLRQLTHSVDLFR